MNLSIKRIMEHFEIVDTRGNFFASADTYKEALLELKELIEAQLQASL